MSMSCKMLNDYIIKKAKVLSDLFDAIVEMDIKTIEFLVRDKLKYELATRNIKSTERVDINYLVSGLERELNTNRIVIIE